MKYLAMFAASIFFAGTGWVWAQSKPETIPYKPTPLAQGKTRYPSGTGTGSNMHSFQMEVRMQMRKIQMDLKSGKITSSQSKEAMQNLKNVRVQELDFFKQNGNREITPSQKTQLEQMLRQNEGSL
jgi:hypothetical protein